MSDLHHYIGDDLSASSTGDLLLTASDSKEGEQRLLRRLLTNPLLLDATGSITVNGDYLWHQEFGAGLGREVGKTLDAARIRSLIRAQMFNEQIVSHSPDPVINVTGIQNGVSVSIQYTDAVSGKPVNLSFDITQ